MIRALRRVTAAAAAFALLAAHACAQEETAYSRTVDVPGVGPRAYYAQNDPKWDTIQYVDSPRLSMGQAGCAPTALAIALAGQLGEEELPSLAAAARDPQKGFRLCACSVKAKWHRGDHEVICPQTGAEYAEWLPVVVAGYAAGNNEGGERFSREHGTSVVLIESFAKACGLEYRSTNDWDEVKRALSEGYSVVTTVGRGVFTGSSHYLCLASVTDGYVYVLDPLMRESYKEDRSGVLEVVEPGLVRAKEEERLKLGLSGFYMIRKK